jgi:hypothetical protein
MLQQIMRQINELTRITVENFEIVNRKLDALKIGVDLTLSTSRLNLDLSKKQEMERFAQAAIDETQATRALERACLAPSKTACDLLSARLTQPTRLGVGLHHGTATESVGRMPSPSSAIRYLAVGLDNDRLREYRRSSSSPYLRHLTGAVIASARERATLTPNERRIADEAWQQLSEFGTTNATVWSESVRIASVMADSGYLGGNQLAETTKLLAAAAVDLERYHRWIGSRPLQLLLHQELGFAAHGMDEAVHKLRAAVLSDSVNMRLSSRWLRAASDRAAFRSFGAAEPCVDNYPFGNAPLSDSLQDRWFTGKNAPPGFRKLAVLENLGVGRLQLCYFGDSPGDKHRLPIYTYVRFLWDAKVMEKDLLRRMLGVPLKNLPDSVVRTVPPRYAPLVYRHAERASSAEMSTFILAADDMYAYGAGPAGEYLPSAHLEVREWLRNGRAYDQTIRDRYLRQARTRSLLTTDIEPILDRVIEYVLLKDMSLLVENLEAETGSVPKAVRPEGYDTDPSVRILRESFVAEFEQYRVRYHLLRGVVQQLSQQGRARSKCLAALSLDTRTPSLVLDPLSLYNARKMGIVGEWDVSMFRRSSDFIFEMLSTVEHRGPGLSERMPVCASPLLPDDFARSKEMLSGLGRRAR